MNPKLLASLLIVFACLAATVEIGASQAPRLYTLELVASPMAPFPFLKKFGKIEISLFPGGVAGESMFLRGFSKNGEQTVTVVNPIGRMYVPVALSKVRDTFLSMSGKKGEMMPGLPEFPVTKLGEGKVKNLPASRYRVQLGPASSIDVWTTNVVPKNRQFEAVYLQLVDAVSHSAVNTIKRIPGTPVYIEMNTQKYKKLPLLALKSFSQTNNEEKEALEVGSFYVKAPILESLLD